jgi:lysophospholipase
MKISFHKIRFVRMVLFTTLWASATSHAIPETQFGEVFWTKAYPHFKSSPIQYFNGVENKRIAYVKFPQSEAKKAIVILTGRVEPMLKYAELVYDLRNKGYSLFLMDHRGQGYSERLLPQSHKGYVKSFDHYVSDFGTFVETIVNPLENGKRKFEKIYVMAHSMGAAVATLYFAKPGSQAISAAAFSSPMYELNLGKYPRIAAEGLLLWSLVRNKMTDYVPDGADFDWSYKFDGNDIQKHGHADNDKTHSPWRFSAERALVQKEPTVALGSPTFQWVGAAITATDKIDRFAPRIKTPILMFQAGLDRVVNAEGQNRFMKRSGNTKAIVFPNSHHEVFQEIDAIRNEALSSALQYFEAN